MTVTKKSGRVLRALYNWFIFFLLAAFLVTCSTMLFVNVFVESLGIELTDDNIQAAAKLTFINVIALSILFSVIDTVRRALTIERVTWHITAAARELVKGNFDVRISPTTSFFADDNYNVIINCFNTMAEELSSVETMRTDFVANVSHEMKTPLSVIQNYGTLLQAPGLTEERRIEYARGVTAAARRLSDMMTNILRLSRLENGSIYPTSADYDLGEQLSECLLQFENVWETKNIEIAADIEADVTVCADAELLSLVWNNLLSNAFKFTDDGGKVGLTLKSVGEYAVVTVSDTGCGMSAEVGERIFEKFYQGDSSRATQGNGLGLALVKRIMDITRGEISVQSAIGEGTAFTVKIRRNISEEAR